MYEATDQLYIRLGGIIGKISDDDKLGTHNKERNLNFQSQLIEVHIGVEYDIINSYEHTVAPYVFAGLADYHFDPYTYDAAKNKVFLQPLGTEGQGAIETRKKYKRIQVCVPLGLGFKHDIDRNWSVGLELGLRHTFTDYIDDVSKTYVDPSLLQRENGQLSPLLADKSRPEEYIPDYTYITEAGQQRGDPRHNDSYLFPIFSLNYRLKTGRVNYPMF